MTAPAARPACMSSRKSPTTSVSSGGTPMAAAACSTPSGAGLGATSPSSRVTITSKSSAVSAVKRARARSTALLPLRVSTPTARPCARSRRTSSSAPSLGADASAASSSKRSRARSAASRSSPGGSARIHSRMYWSGGQPISRLMAGKSIAPGCVRVPSKSKRTARSRNGRAALTPARPPSPSLGEGLEADIAPAVHARGVGPRRAVAAHEALSLPGRRRRTSDRRARVLDRQRVSLARRVEPDGDHERLALVDRAACWRAAR